MPCVGNLALFFTFVWYPGHVGIQSNEEADAAARNAADSPQVDAIVIQPEDATVVTTTNIINVRQQT